MLNNSGTGVVYDGTENYVATYSLLMLGHRVMYITVDQSSPNLEMWFRAPGRFHWVKSGMTATRSTNDPTRVSGLHIAEYVHRNLSFLLVATANPGFAKIWIDAVHSKNEQFVDGGIADIEAFLKSLPPKS